MEIQSADIQTLMDLGLTLLQARVYRTLAKAGALKIDTISKLSIVARPDVYRTLAKLEQLGLVERIIKTPLHFRAIPMEKGLALLLESKTEEHEKLKTETELLLQTLKEITSDEILQTEDQQFVLIPPKRTIIKRINEATEKAQESVDLSLSWKRFSLGITTAFAESGKKARARNVKLRFVVENPTEGNAPEQITQFCRRNPNIQLRFSKERPKTLLGIYDKKEVFIIVNPQMDIPDSPAFWSNNQSIVAMAQDYFDNLWNNATENPDCKAIDTAFGI